jgi:hypothetical protein
MQRKEQAPPSPAALVEVALNKPHTHNGQQLAAGTVIKITEDQKTWLTRQGVIGGQHKEHNDV